MRIEFTVMEGSFSLFLSFFSLATLLNVAFINLYIPRDDQLC